MRSIVILFLLLISPPILAANCVEDVPFRFGQTEPMNCAPNMVDLLNQSSGGAQFLKDNPSFNLSEVKQACRKGSISGIVCDAYRQAKK